MFWNLFIDPLCYGLPILSAAKKDIYFAPTQSWENKLHGAKHTSYKDKLATYLAAAFTCSFVCILRRLYGLLQSDIFG